MKGFAFIGGDKPSLEIDLQIQKNDILVAADAGLGILAERGLKADWIIGDMDSVSPPSLLDTYPAERIKRYHTDKDYTDTELALEFLADLGCTETVLVGGGGGRLDHLLALFALFERPQYPQRWISACSDIVCLDGGQPGRGMRLSNSQAITASVFPVGQGPWQSAASGWQWNLDAFNWKRDTYSLSNRTNAPTTAFTAQQGRFLVILPPGTSWSRL